MEIEELGDIMPSHCMSTGTRFDLFYRYYLSEDPLDLGNFLRLSPREFDEIVELVKNHMRWKKTHRYPIKKMEYVVICLR